MKTFIVLAIISLLSPCHVLSGSRKAEGSYALVAENMAGAAAKKSRKRIAVLPFTNENGRKNRASVLITERLSSHIASRQGINLIERGRLDAILKEQGLHSSGIVDAHTASSIGAVLGANAVITGTVIDIGNGMVELNARLVDTRTARVLNAVNRKITKDWKESGAWPAGGAFDLPDENRWELPPVPETGEYLYNTAAPFFESCSRAQEEAQKLKNLVIEIKARRLAIRLKSGEINIKKLTRNPGSDISDPALRSKFYLKLRYWYYNTQIPALTEQEKMLLKTADLLLKQLNSFCRE